MNKYDKQHLRNLQRYEAMITALFDAAAKDAAKLSSLINGIGDAPYSWADYPLAKAKIDDIVAQLNSEVFGAVVNGVRSEWSLSNSKNNFLVQTALGSNADSLPEAVARRYFNNNETAREAFLLRKESGLGLSDNVWRYTNQFKSEIEMALDIGIRSGKSADEISRDVRDYLKYPDKLFRRVRDEHGQLHLSQRASEFHPGRGVYRSSYMNARRLAATETNIAYRTADHLRWQELDFVVGIEIHLSNNHNCKGVPAGTYFDICDELQGRYPKDFKFTGWHPHCRCWVETILKTEAEMAEDNARIMAGEDVSESSENAVDALPSNFTAWRENNAERIERAKNLPYFLRDNQALIEGQRLTDKSDILRRAEESIAQYCDKHRTFDFMVFNQDTFDNMQAWAIKSSGQHWLDASPEVRQAIIDYTGNKWGRINRSLFALEENTPEGELIDRLLDKVKLPQDMVLRRGTSYDELLSVFGQQFHDLARAGDVESMNKLAGITGVNEAFISTACNKLGGFQNATVDLTIFAPKGTHAIFARPFSAVEARHPEKWDGKTPVGSFIENRENEFIVHRGYTYRFVKAEIEPGLFKGGHTVKVWVELLTRNNRKVK